MASRDGRRAKALYFVTPGSIHCTSCIRWNEGIVPVSGQIWGQLFQEICP
jgi:hypothetical protein